MSILLSARTKKGLTQSQVALKCGITRQYYGQIESGERTPPTPLGVMIAITLDSSVEALFGEMALPEGVRPVPHQLTDHSATHRRVRAYCEAMNLAPVVTGIDGELLGFIDAGKVDVTDARYTLYDYQRGKLVESDHGGFYAVRIEEGN